MKDLQEVYIARYFKNGETGVWNFHQYSFQISLVGILIRQFGLILHFENFKKYGRCFTDRIFIYIFFKIILCISSRTIKEHFLT